jgi:hypothetical protein
MEIKDIIANVKDIIYSESMVKQLSDIGITEYERGIVAGKIQMISYIEQELNRDYEDEDSSL